MRILACPGSFLSGRSPLQPSARQALQGNVQYNTIQANGSGNASGRRTDSETLPCLCGLSLAGHRSRRYAPFEPERKGRTGPIRWRERQVRYNKRNVGNRIDATPGGFRR